MRCGTCGPSLWASSRENEGPIGPFFCCRSWLWRSLCRSVCWTLTRASSKRPQDENGTCNTAYRRWCNAMVLMLHQNKNLVVVGPSVRSFVRPSVRLVSLVYSFALLVGCTEEGRTSGNMDARTDAQTNVNLPAECSRDAHTDRRARILAGASETHSQNYQQLQCSSSSSRRFC